MLDLEPLEDRTAPSDLFAFSRLEVQAPAALVNPVYLYNWIRLETFAAQWGHGIPWAPNRILQLDLSPAQAGAWGIGGTVAREVVPIGNSWTEPGGELPVILASPGHYGFEAGTIWEETSLALGWWYQDWPGWAADVPTNWMPPGPQWGQVLGPPSYTMADVLFVQGNPYWWYFI